MLHLSVCITRINLQQDMKNAKATLSLFTLRYHGSSMFIHSNTLAFPGWRGGPSGAAAVRQSGFPGRQVDGVRGAPLLPAAIIPAQCGATVCHGAAARAMLKHRRVTAMTIETI